MDKVEINLAAIVGGKEAVMAEFATVITRRRVVSLAMCMHEAVNIVKRRALEFLREVIRPAIDQAHLELSINLGTPSPEWPFVRKEDWGDAMDDKLENVIEPYAHVLSSDWTARFVIGSRLYDPDGPENWINEFAGEVWRNITYAHKHANEGAPKTPAQIMSSVGIVGSDFAPYINSADTATEITEASTEEKEAPPMSTLPETIAKLYAWHSMTGRAPHEVVALLDNATDSDDGLAWSGIQQLGGDMSDVNALRMSGLTKELLAQAIMTGTAPSVATQPVAPPPAPIPPQPMDDLAAMFGGAPVPVEQPAQASYVPMEQSSPQTAYVQPQAAAPPPAKRSKKGEPVAGAIPARVLAIMKEHTGLKSEEVGAALGVSRGTFDNYAKGKANLVPDVQQLTYLRNTLQQKIALLNEAASLLPQ